MRDGVLKRLRATAVAVAGMVVVTGIAAAAPAKNPNDVRTQARDVQLRHARVVHHAVKPGHAHPRTATAQVLVARAAYGEKPPATGWPALVTEARKYMGTNPTSRSRLWCARFMNLVLAKTGYAGTGSDAARSFASYGRRIGEPKIGAIAVLTRGKHGGHVGIVTGIDANGNPIIISGNHGHRVGEGVYPKRRVIAYVLPVGRRPLTQVASAGANAPVRSDANDDGASPISELLAAINDETPHTAPGPSPFGAAQRLIERKPDAAPARTEVRASVRPYRLVQQMPAAPEPVPVRVAAAYHVTVERSATPPMPRPRLATPPLPRKRPPSQ